MISLRLVPRRISALCSLVASTGKPPPSAYPLGSLVGIPKAAAAQHIAQRDEVVAHDAIDAEVEQSPNHWRVIDGPYMHRGAPPVREVDEPRIDDGHAPCAQWHLYARDARARDRQPERPRAQTPYRRGTAGHADARSEARPQSDETPVGERGDAHPLERGGAVQHPDQGLDHGVVLRVDVEERIRERAEKFLEQHDWFRARDSRRLHLLPRQFRDDAALVGDPIEYVVVECQHDPVGRRMCIGFEVAKAERARVYERRPRVLGTVAGTAAMSEGYGSFVVEVGEHRPDDTSVSIDG